MCLRIYPSNWVPNSCQSRRGQSALPSPQTPPRQTVQVPSSRDKKSEEAEQRVTSRGTPLLPASRVGSPRLSRSQITLLPRHTPPFHRCLLSDCPLPGIEDRGDMQRDQRPALTGRLSIFGRRTGEEKARDTRRCHEWCVPPREQKDHVSRDQFRARTGSLGRGAEGCSVMGRTFQAVETVLPTP